MEYKKLRITFDYPDKDRFYRVLLVKPNISLVDLGCVILTSLRSDFSHCFYFKDKDKNYNPKVFMEDFVRSNDLLMNDYTLEDLHQKFDFFYDTGDGWQFNCEKGKGTVEYEPNLEQGENEDAILIEGKGIGIYEDDISALYAYLDGKLKPDNLKEKPSIGAYIPHNIEIGQWGDFDKYDLEDAKHEFNAKVDFDRETYKQNDNEDCWDDKGDYPFGNDQDEASLKNSNVEFHNSINTLLDLMIKENEVVQETFNKLKKTFKKAKALDIMAKALVVELYECGKRGISFDMDDYLIIIDTFTMECNQ